MFDIGFSEVLLIFVIALVVLGPEKLPRLASQVGRWIGRARAMARQFREQLEEEVNLEEVRRAHETKPQKPAETEPTSAAGAAGVHAAADAPGTAPGAESGAGANHGPYGQSPQPDAASPQTLGEVAYQGPDPTEFRADTFSHAHPTNEYGANPLTANGAAPEPSPSAPEADVSTASEANVAAAQSESSADRPAPEGVAPTQRAAGGEAYASNTPHAAPAATSEPTRRPVVEGADTHGQS